MFQEMLAHWEIFTVHFFDFFSGSYEKKKKKINDCISNITEADVNIFLFVIFWWFVISKGIQPLFVDVHIFAHWAERLQWENITRHTILIAARRWAWCWFWCCCCWWWRCSTFRGPLNWLKWDDWCTIYMVVSAAIARLYVCATTLCVRCPYQAERYRVCSAHFCYVDWRTLIN